MSSATYPKYKTWAENEDLTTVDLNAHIDNERNNLNPSGAGGYSDSVSQMKIQTDPGGLGTESLATSTAGELERLRFEINRIVGKTYHYETPDISLSQANTLFNQISGLPPSRLVSGRKSATSNQAMFLVPDGTLAKVTLKAGGSNPNFNVFIDGASYVRSADQTFTTLSLAPSTNNTATVNDATIVNDKYAGEVDYNIPTITLSGVGTNISGLVGKFAAFKFTDGGQTEYFLGFVSSSTTLTNCRRGFFFNEIDVPKVRVNLNNGDTITLLRLSWIFETTGGTLDVIYVNPTWSVPTPTSPNIGDYWYDITHQTWKKYNGSSFVAANSTLIGMSIQDTTKCVAARSFEYFCIYSQLNEIGLKQNTTSEISSTKPGQKINVAGSIVDYGHNFLVWDVPGNLASPLTLQANTKYYVYVSDKSEFFFDTERPYDRTADMLALYHPYNTWRAVGSVTTDGGSLFVSATLFTYSKSAEIPDVYFQAQMSADDPGNGSGSSVRVPYDVAEFDTHAPAFVGGSSNSYTIPTAGVYRMSANAMAKATTGGAVVTAYTLHLYKNGAIHRVFGVMGPLETSLANMNGMCLEKCVAGDIFTVFVTVTVSAGTFSILADSGSGGFGSCFSVERIGS